MVNLRSLPLCVLASTLLASIASIAQQPAPAARITGPIDDNQLVVLRGNTHPAAITKNDRGPVSPGFSLPDLTLVLSRSPEQQAAFDAFVKGQYETGSPNFHQWLTPSQIGVQFGPAPADISAITGWLSSHGFAIKKVTPDGMTIRFSGTAAQVESTFHTSIHNLSVNGVPHYANMSDPQIPAALAPVVLGVKALHNFLPKPQHKLGSLVQFNKEAGKWQRVSNTSATKSSAAGSAPSLSTLGTGSKPAINPRPLFGINGSTDGSTFLEEDVTPYDFATIYNVLPLWNNNINGTGQTIAIVGTSLINVGKNGGANDVATYRSAFGLPAGLTPNEIDTGAGPAATICTSTSTTAVCGISDLTENSLDVEVSGAVAPSAQIDLVVTGNNTEGSIDTVYDSASYIVDNLTAKILSASYGACELEQGTAENVAYYDLWQTAAAEGISVFVATGDSGSPSCDDGLDASYGNPYVAQYGLSVSGIASTPFNTAVGGTDFSWCQPYYNTNNGDFEGCATSSTTQSSPAYWNTSNNATTGASAAGYVPETPWNDTCENPINARLLETELNISGVDSNFGVNPSTPEETCSVIYNGASEFDQFVEEEDDFNPSFELSVDTVGGGGGASGCVVNSTNPNGETLGACSTGATSTGATTNPDTGAAQGSITLVNDGWPKPSWQTGVSGIPSDGVRDLPDVSFFAGNGNLDSATLICLSNVGACTYSDTTENTAQELGGTSVATPEMAGVMALINQKAGGAQGLPNAQLYKLAGAQNYASCSAESVTASSACYFQDIDNGPTGSPGPAYANAQTISMPCDLNNAPEGGDLGGEFAGTTSPNCAALNSGDTVGTLVTSGNTPAYNSTTGFDLATGLGSLNVANVVNAWVSDAGTAAATMTVTVTPSSSSISATIPVMLAVTVTGTGSQGTPTGTVTVSGGGYNTSQTLSAGSVTITIPAGSLAPGSDTLTVTYSGDMNYASITQTESLTVSAAAPTVMIDAPASDNIANAVPVTVTVSGPITGATPSGTVTLTGGSYSSTAAMLTSGTASFTIPAGDLPAGTDTLTSSYSGSSTYAGAMGTTTILIVGTALVTPTVTVTPAPTSIDTSQPLTVTIVVSGTGGTIPTGTITLTSSSAKGTLGTSQLSMGTATATISIPGSTLSAGTDTLTAAYSGDANYASVMGTGTVTVTQSVYALSATAPAAVAPGATATSTISGTASTTDYSGIVTVNSCTVTNGPTNAVNVPGCTVSGTITYASGTPSGTATATVATSSAAMAKLVRPRSGWLGAGGGAVLAFLVFLGIPARRRSWRALLGMVILLATLSSLSACGGSVSGIGTTSATTVGTYTFTVTGQGNDPANTSESTTFTLTVN